MKIDFKNSKNRANKQQIWYINLLFENLSFTSPQKRDYLNLRYAKLYTDELSSSQASQVIEDLKERLEKG